MQNVFIFFCVIFGFSYVFWCVDHYVTDKKYPISYVVSAINAVVLIGIIIFSANYERPTSPAPERFMKITITKAGVSASTVEPLDVERILQLRDSSDIQIELVK